MEPVEIERTTLIPARSSLRYEKEYEVFQEWRKQNNMENGVNENVLMTYFTEASKKINPSSLWAKYSMLKSMLSFKEAVDISKYLELTKFLKKQSIGYQPNKSKILTRDEVICFMREAPTKDYLLLKVIAMIGIAGGCRREELYNMTIDDVEDIGTKLVITIPCTKTNSRRVFTLINDCAGINILEMYRKYISLRPNNYSEKALFIAYRKGKCISQRVGIHTIAGAPKKIAEYLKLDQPKRYTGHCFRRTSATLLSNAVVDLNVLMKRQGGWRNSSTVEVFIENKDNEPILKQKKPRLTEAVENVKLEIKSEDESISEDENFQVPEYVEFYADPEESKCDEVDLHHSNVIEDEQSGIGNQIRNDSKNAAVLEQTSNETKNVLQQPPSQAGMIFQQQSISLPSIHLQTTSTEHITNSRTKEENRDDNKTDEKFLSPKLDSLENISTSAATTKSIKSEFDIFGQGVAAQLNNMPFEDALQLQLEIQQLITRKRLNNRI